MLESEDTRFRAKRLHIDVQAKVHIEKVTIAALGTGCGNDVRDGVHVGQVTGCGNDIVEAGVAGCMLELKDARWHAKRLHIDIQEEVTIEEVTIAEP
jgi:hypothetical protein